MARILCCGEIMIELSRRPGAAGLHVACGGDAFNAAVHLARAGHEVALLTALGADAASAELRERIEGEGISTDFLLRHPHRSAGIYAIAVDSDGERSFAYWRDSSAARDMFALPEIAGVVSHAATADLLFYSLITLAILPPEGRAALLDLAQNIRGNGGKVAFDGNYRPRLWPRQSDAADWRDRAVREADFGFPTFDDERLLGFENPASVLAHWQELGCRETVVKLGRDGCLLPDGALVRPVRALAAVDTSGAGDAFDAGYLAVRLCGARAEYAAAAGHATAGWTIMRNGAIPDSDVEAQQIYSAFTRHRGLLESLSS